LNDEGITIVMVTHERDFARYARRIVEMRDGLILKDWMVSKPRSAREDLSNFKNHRDLDD